MIQEDLGIVLRSQPFKERDRLVTLLTEHHGKITGVAQNSIHSKRFGGSLDLFTCSQIRYKDSPTSELVRIEETNIRRDFLSLRKKLENVSAAGYFVDLCLRLTEERQTVREIFLLLAHYLYLLEDETATLEMVRSFEVKLLDRLGYGPNLDQCVSCEAELSTDGITLAIDRGGFLCRQCAPLDGKKFSYESLQWLRLARYSPIQSSHELRMSAESLTEGGHIIQNFLRYHGPGLTNHSFQSHEMMENILRENHLSSESTL
jgi:DNA repair protein RecO (recombination protein O)